MLLSGLSTRQRSSIKQKYCTPHFLLKHSSLSYKVSTRSSVFLRLDTTAMAQLRLCTPPSDAFLLLTVTILELFALGVLWSLRTLRGNLPSLGLHGSGWRLTG